MNIDNIPWVPTPRLPRWQDVWAAALRRSARNAARRDPPPRPWKVHHTGRYRQRKAPR